MNQEQLKTAYQYILPQHSLSRLVGKLADSKVGWIKGPFIRHFKDAFDVDLSEAELESVDDYATFNDFFTRALKPTARPIAEDWDLVSPVDGEVSQLGPIKQDQIFQAKGHDYSLDKLLGHTAMTEHYLNGQFATLYLSPKDYHRIHAPMAGTLVSMTYVPGALFSVNQITARTIPDLFARNERLVVHLQTDIGPLAMVFVGATIVASIETVWSGVVTPPTGPAIHSWSYEDKNITFAKGEEMARFKLGSTVIIVAPENTIEWQHELDAGSAVRMGRGIASFTANSAD